MGVEQLQLQLHAQRQRLRWREFAQTIGRCRLNVFDFMRHDASILTLPPTA